jgi:hypothetical protein
MLTRDQILAADDLPMEEVEVPEWGGSVFVRGMQGNERDRFEMGMYLTKDDLEEKAVVRARVVAWCALDDKRRQLFTTADVEWLGRKSGRALDRIFDVAKRLSGIGEKATKAAEEDFADGQNGASTSVWPDTSAALSASSSPGSPPLS